MEFWRKDAARKIAVGTSWAIAATKYQSWGPVMSGAIALGSLHFLARRPPAQNPPDRLPRWEDDTVADALIDEANQLELDGEHTKALLMLLDWDRNFDPDIDGTYGDRVNVLVQAARLCTVINAVFRTETPLDTVCARIAAHCLGSESAMDSLYAYREYLLEPDDSEEQELTGAIAKAIKLSIDPEDNSERVQKLRDYANKMFAVVGLADEAMLHMADDPLELEFTFPEYNEVANQVWETPGKDKDFDR